MSKEVMDMVGELISVTMPVLKGKDVSVILNAVNRFHALMLVYYLKQDALEEYTAKAQEGLMKNVEYISTAVDG